jgi:hypothetical protein
MMIMMMVMAKGDYQGSNLEKKKQKNQMGSR